MSARSGKHEKVDQLTMKLFAPGMSLLHRAGLGGLACTLQAMERQYRVGTLAQSKLPAPFDDDQPPWEISEQTVTLKFGKPETASKYLKKLFEFAFALRKDGLMILPGQFDTEPAAAVLADLQLGFMLTFLQHGKVRQLAKEPSTVTYDPEGDGVLGIIVQYRKCSGFKHQGGWQNFADKNGCLIRGMLKVDGPISPGTAVRHVAFTGDTAAEDPPERMLPLYFAIVGCLPLPVNRGVATLLVPQVENLLEFTIDRPFMSPTMAKECQIANAADAALQAQLRLRNRSRDIQVKSRAKRTVVGTAIPGCFAMTFTPTPWASQQKSRVATIHVPPGDEKLLNRFDSALANLPLRIVTRTIKTSTGRGKKKTVTADQESFRSESVIRPLIAENLALGRPWYAGFVRLMTKTNPATDKPFRNQLPFERKGLHDMISDSTMWDHDGEKLVVQAVHEAIRQTLGRIREETDGKASNSISQATQNRWERFREKLRLDLAGAKTPAHVRFSLMDLFSRGGSNSVLQAEWQKIIPVIRADWQLARDLGLLALASYAGKSEGSNKSGDEESTKL